MGFIPRQESIHFRACSVTPRGPSLYHIFSGNAVAEGFVVGTVVAFCEAGIRLGWVIGLEMTFSSVILGQMYEGKQKRRTRAMKVIMLENFKVEGRLERYIGNTCVVHQLET